MKFERAKGIHLTAIANLYGFKRKWFEKIPWMGDWLLRRRTLKGWIDMGDRAAKRNFTLLDGDKIKPALNQGGMIKRRMSWGTHLWLCEKMI